MKKTSARVRGCESARARGSPAARLHPRTLALSHLLLLPVALAQTQDGGPIVVGDQRPQFKGIELRQFDASLDLWNQWRVDKLRQQGQPTLTEKENLYRQTLDLSGDFSIGHKNLIDVSGTAKLGLEEDDLKSGETGASNSYVAVTDLFDLKALILGNGPVPTTVYGRRDESYIHEDFGGSIKSTITEFGGIAQIRSQVAPTQVQVFHRESDQSDQLGRGGFGYTQDSAILHSDIRLTTNQRLLADYTFDHVSELNTSGATSFRDTYDQHDANLTHWLNFGAQDRSSLRSTLRIEDRDGRFSERIEHLDEELTLEHTPRLETRYDLSLEDLTREGVDQRLARGSALVRHHLFDSLTSTATVGASALDVPDQFASNELFANLGLEYTKKAPFGRVNADATLGVTRQNNGARGTTVPVANGAFVFSDPFPVTISRRNIIPASIVVRDANRLRLFIENLDYTVQAFEDRVELRRVVGGAISNGQTVSIDFDVGPDAANTIDSTTGSFTLRYDVADGWLSGLSVYGAYRQLDQNASGKGADRFVLDNVKDFRLGAEYRIAGATFLSEYEDHESTVAPFNSWRLQAQYDHRFARQSLLTLSLSREDVTFRDTDSKVELYLANARWTQQLIENLDMSIHVQGRLENHNDSPDIKGVESGLDVSWHKGRTTIYASAFISTLNADGSSTLSETLSVGLKRAF